jgi:hypothetical protein
VSNLLKLLTTSPEAVILLIFLVVPGFVFVKVVDALIPGRRRSFGKEIFDVVCWSFATLAVWFVPALMLFRIGDSLPWWLYYPLVLAIVGLGVFATPILLAYIFDRLEGRGYLKDLGVHSNPTTWDWFFSNRAGNYYVRFHRKEGKDFGGYFGENSFAASSPNAQQIYVEELWRVDEEGKFIERVEGSKGALINSEDCEFIEFFEAREAREGKTLEEGRTEPTATATFRKPSGR